MGGGADGPAEACAARIDVQDVILHGGGGIAQHGHERFAFQPQRSGGGGQPGQFQQGGEKIDRFHHRRAVSAGLGGAGGGDHEGNPGGLFVVGVFAPHRVVAEVPAVVAPKHDDRLLGQGEPVQFIQHFSQLGIHVADRGVITVDEGALEILRQIALFRDA